MQDRLDKVAQQIHTGRQRLRGGTIAEEELTETAGVLEEQEVE